MAALAPQGVLVSHYFPGLQTVAAIVLKLASRDVRPARAPRMRQRQCRRRLCGSPPRHKRASGPARPPNALGAVRRGEPVKARQRALKAAQAGKDSQPSLRPLSASRAQSFYAPGSIHLGSLPLRHLRRLQVDQRAELGPLLLDRDQQFAEAHVVHLAADIARKADRR
jgi:hypothetical protein